MAEVRKKQSNYLINFVNQEEKLQLKYCSLTK